ncbi:16S rRNA (guanine(527)-N(7))-methyltransferase RsmG [Methyloceanibacter sp.]|uniref:16S rRNA (guanine(527)-N(7))-methyltransferase RsmG n=1 Tax=Methyloceanibacter sp. TaxID=1965321 RepID=UPI003D6D64B5
MEDRLTATGAKRSNPISGPEQFAEAYKVPRETIHRLICYADLLTEWQDRANLVSAKTLPQLWDRHFADSAQILRLAPGAQVWLDLGSGAGFPGLVIAILQANHANFRMHLVEATAKKCAFLAEVARATSAPVEIHCMRIEELSKTATSLKPEIVTARALAPLPHLLELAAPWLRSRARGLFLKGRDAGKEIESAKRRFHFTCHLHPSMTADVSYILEIGDLAKRAKVKAR